MPISLQKDSEFFIAICQYQIHSYVTLGAKEANQAPVLLGAFGKLRYGSYGSCSASIENENVFGSKASEVSYKAYEITFQHYQQLLRRMAAISEKQRQKDHRNVALQAYDIVAENDQAWELEKKPLLSPENDQPLTPSESRLTPVNTCRHTAIHFVDEARQSPGMKGEGISSLFFIKPPLKAVFEKGRVEDKHPFFVLPLPPTAFPHIKGEKKQILNDLYKRLDKMLLIAQHNKITAIKFNELKELYKDVAGPVMPENILEVIAAIEDWEKGHKDLIKAHRRFAWSPFATATETLFKNFNKRFEMIKKQEQDLPKVVEPVIISIP